MKPLTVIERSTRRTIKEGTFPNGFPEPNTLIIDRDRNCAEYIPPDTERPFCNAYMVPMVLAEQIQKLVNGAQIKMPSSIEEGGLPIVNCAKDSCKIS